MIPAQCRVLHHICGAQRSYECYDLDLVARPTTKEEKRFVKINYGMKKLATQLDLPLT